MGYLQTLQLMVRAYKAARGVMPKGLDLLKMKMKARQKVIDSTKGKILQFPKERITDWTKARPQPPKIEMKGGIQTTRGLGDLFKRQMAKKGKELDELIRKGTIKVGQVTKRKKVKEPVDPKLYQQERIKEIMKQNKESAKRLEKKMNKEKDLGDKLKDYKGDPDAMREGGIISLANGGLTNISDTYDNNPTLQAQYPNKQDYLDLFTQQTTTTTPQTNTTTQSTTSTIAPINPINPIIPLPQDSGDGGGGILNNFGRTNMNQPNAMGGKEPGIVAALQRTLGDVKTAGKEIYSLLSPMQMAKRTMDSINNMRAKQAAEIIEQIRREEEARLQAQLNRPRVPGGTIDSGNQGSGGYGGTGGEGPSAVGSSGMLGGGV